MRSKLIACTALGLTLGLPAGAAGAPFTTGDLVVVRVGDGTGLHGGTGDPVFLDEYSPTGALVQSIQLPSAGAGDQHALVLGGVGTVLLNGGDGQITRSADKRFLVVAGYGRDVGGSGPITSTNPSTVPRVIARVAAGGAVDTTTALSDFGGSSGSAIRGAATVDGSAYWASGQVLTSYATDPPIRYATHGATTSTALSTTVMTQSGLRVPGIFGGQLFVTSPSGAPAPRLGQVGSGLPTTSGQTITSVSSAIDTTAQTPNGFVFLDLDPAIPGDDTLYLADEQSQSSNADGMIRKYSFDGTTWTARGSVTATDVRGLTGSVDGGTVTLFGSTGGGGTSGCPSCQMPPSGGGALYKLTDASGSTGALAGTADTIATPAANTGFRGVALAPVAPTSGSAPACIGTDAATTYGKAVQITLACTDPDGDPITRRIVKAPARGTLGPIDPATGSVTYTPKDGEVGADSFSFAGNDGSLESDAAAVTVSIAPPPIEALPRAARLARVRLGAGSLAADVVCGSGTAACSGRLRFAVEPNVGRIGRLGGVKYQVPSGQTRTVKIGLTRDARRALARRRVTVVATGFLSQARGGTTPLIAYAVLNGALRPAATRAPDLPKPEPAERIEQHVVPLPPSVTGVQFPTYTVDGSRILATAVSTAWSGRQLVSFAEDGGDLRCLTCGSWTGDELFKPYAFADGKRVLVRVGSQTPSTPADHAVVECSPSVRDCTRAKVVPIVPPAADDPGVVQDQREFRVSPDGVHVAFSQIRKTASGGSDGVGVVGTLTRSGDVYKVDDPRVVATTGELKGFSADGKAVLFARFTGAFEAGNPEDVVIDLRTGRERRADNSLDWDEDIDYTANRYRGRGWMVIGSGRGTHVLETVSRIRRPTFIELGISALPFAAFAADTPAIAEPWLVDEYGARGSYSGQPLAPGAIADGWDSRPTFRWKPDGTAVVFWQKRIAGDSTRVVVVRLPKRSPVKLKTPPVAPTPRWAPSLKGYVPADPSAPVSQDGKVSGRIEVVSKASTRSGYDRYVAVVYQNYADEPGFVLNGVEHADYKTPGLYGGQALYSADLTVSGAHRGSLSATDVVIDTSSIKGVIGSELDGRSMTLGPLP
jgi:hypothetical protein